MLDQLRSGDVVNVMRLECPARSTSDLLHIVNRVTEKKAGLRSSAEPWADTTSPAGTMIMTVLAGIADFERSLILDRTSVGRAASIACGVRFGPPGVAPEIPNALSAEQVEHARQVIEAEQKSVASIARLFGVHRATLYGALRVC